MKHIESKQNAIIKKYEEDNNCTINNNNLAAILYGRSDRSACVTSSNWRKKTDFRCGSLDAAKRFCHFFNVNLEDLLK